MLSVYEGGWVEVDLVARECLVYAEDGCGCRDVGALEDKLWSLRRIRTAALAFSCLVWGVDDKLSSTRRML